MAALAKSGLEESLAYLSPIAGLPTAQLAAGQAAAGINGLTSGVVTPTTGKSLIIFWVRSIFKKKDLTSGISTMKIASPNLLWNHSKIVEVMEIQFENAFLLLHISEFRMLCVFVIFLGGIKRRRVVVSFLSRMLRCNLILGKRLTFLQLPTPQPHFFLRWPFS